MINLCTLFDSNYLDKGIALYNSLEKYTTDFSLYVLCFDEKCKIVLSNLNYVHMKLISLDDFETAELINVKKERSKAEYCWTCTAILIEYVIKRFKLEGCTYIDSDLFFYSNPNVLFEEFKNQDIDVAIMEHRFSEKDWKKRKVRQSGRFCVEFNYFKNSTNGLNALQWWKKECLNWCFHKFEPADVYPIARYGDQKYLELFPIIFDKVYIIQNLGAGIAPWNIKQYCLNNVSENNIYLTYKKTNQTIPLVFYHFQNIKYISEDFVNINSQTVDKALKKVIYEPYLREIESVRKMLKERFGISFAVKKSYSSNKIKAFIQKNIMQYRIRSFSDIVNLNKVR